MTPVTHPRMLHRITTGFLIWKIMSDLRIIFYIRELVRKVPIVLVASATGAIGPEASYGKIKLLDFYPTALKGCRGIVFTHGVRMGGRAAGKSLSELYLRNRKV